MSEDCTIDEITDIMNKFVNAAKNGTNRSISTNVIGMSKVGVTAATKVQQRLFNKDSHRDDIIVNCCCPGLVSTNMSNYRGIPVDEGAITPVYLSLLPENVNEPKGELWAEKERVEWSDLNWQWPQSLIDAYSKKQ